MQNDLFSVGSPQIIPISHGELWYFPGWLTAVQAQDFFSQLVEETSWEQTQIRIANKLLPIPRLNAWYGDAGTAYQYSGHTFSPLPFTETLNELKSGVNNTFSDHFRFPPLKINSALLNQYRDGRDSVGWHADDEDELGASPQIASVSLGGTRRLLLKPKKSRLPKPLEIKLTNGSLLLMLGDMQGHWLHSIPKTEQFSEIRVNITFREVVNKQV